MFIRLLLSAPDTPPRLWPGQILARRVLIPLLRRLLILGLELGVEHGEYDPNETHGPNPGRQADPQEPVE